MSNVYFIERPSTTRKKWTLEEGKDRGRVGTSELDLKICPEGRNLSRNDCGIRLNLRGT